MRQPGEGPLDHPAARDHMKAGTRPIESPVDLLRRNIVGYPVILAPMDAFDRFDPPSGRLLARYPFSDRF